MERSRDSRRVTSNGLSRRRHRSSSIRDSPEDDGPVELPEAVRRKKDRDRERERDRERDRDRDRLNSRRKRRRGDRLFHGTNREDGGDYSSEESVNEEEDEEEEEEEEDDGGPRSSMRMLPPNPSSFSNNQNHLHHHRKSFPPPAKVFKASPPPPTTATVTPWKAPDEMIGVSVPRKARSASAKRSHDCWASNGGVGTEQINRQASSSPVRSTGPCVTTVLASASASPAPVSPSSSNASVKKKMKPTGSKQRPPKSSSKSASSTQDEIEMEIAQVLYGLMNQPQGPSRQDTIAGDGMKFDSSKEMSNHKLTADAKSRVSSPISNSLPQSSSIPLTNSSSFSTTPISAIAPKRKRPRPVKYEDESQSNLPVRNSPISSTTKVDLDLPPQIDNYSPNAEKNSTNPVENGEVSCKLLVNHSTSSPAELQLQPDSLKKENLSSSTLLSDLKQVTEDLETEEPLSLKKESPSRVGLEDDCETLAPKPKTMVSENEGQREEKFQIDLMAPPPLRSSPERDSEIDFVVVDPKAVVRDVETATVKEKEKAVKIGKEDMNVEVDEKKAKVAAIGEVESLKPNVNNKERNVDLQLDSEKSDRNSGTVTVSRSGDKPQQDIQEQHQQPNLEKNSQSSSLSLPMSMAGWPGLPHMGYMAPLQGVVSVDGSSVASAALQPPHLLVNQPRPKRCATHWYIARNIHYHQQFTRMNPFWPAAPGSALQLGPKACNLNAVPPTEMQAGKGLNAVQDKGQGLPSHLGKDKSSQAGNITETAQRKQILLQQALPPGAPSNILHGPAFIFPLNQQQSAVTNSVRASAKSPLPAGGATSSASSSASVSASSTTVVTGPAMSFNYPNMPGNETPYLILQNGPYPIPIPAHLGPAPAYRGTHPQPMPFFNGAFYSSQILHPSQLQQQQPPPTQLQQSQQGHQHQSISSGSSSSQKHLQNQVNQQRPHGSVTNGSNGNLQGFPTTKTQTSQSLQLQQRQQGQNALHQAGLEGELASEDSPSSADSQVPRASMNIYGHNFPMPMHPPNFAMMHPASVSTSGAVNNAGGNPSEKKQLQLQPHSTKAGVELLPSQAFAMSFASINGAAAAPGLDISAIAQNHALLQSLPEPARHGYQFMAAAAAAQAAQHRKRENESSSVEDERKSMAGGKTAATSGQLIAFSRPDLTDASVSAAPSSTVIDSSARTLNLGSTTARTSNDVTSAAMNSTSISMQQQLQRTQQQPTSQPQQMIQLQKQQLLAPSSTASARSKAPTSGGGNVYADHISTPSSIAAKFPNVLSGFPQNLVQSSSSPAQSPQWKNSVRSTTSQIPSQSFASTSSALKNLSQQQGRTQQGHTQISFAANSKSSAISQGQPPTNSNQSPSPSMGMGSPTTSSISKGAGGSPRTTSTSTSNKAGQASSLSSQQTKTNSVSTQKSCAIGGRNIQPILGHPHNIVPSSSPGAMPQLQQQQQQHQQQVTKHAMQQQMMYANAYMQAQAHRAANLSNTSSPASGFYLQRHRDQQQKQPPGSSGVSTGMLSLSNTNISDPSKAVVSAGTAASNIKGGGLPAQGHVHAQFVAATAQSAGKAHQLLSASFPYGHAVPAAVQVKPAEQKQQAGE
ncbi:hypothetical protein K2173_022386 [Erythroxylum novogranatense]|uniref:Time for coffee n=1 Tax=Erythroxylum novogranatense TaxID=1862640 RepID=A0AAV8THH3_9ROSI|nr:hypothetical protein K2173_022386 [Erythroxylum novogranatense]